MALSCVGLCLNQTLHEADRGKMRKVGVLPSLYRGISPPIAVSHSLTLSLSLLFFPASRLHSACSAVAVPEESFSGC